MKNLVKVSALAIATILIFSGCGNKAENITTTETTSSYIYQEPLTEAPANTDVVTDTAPVVDSTAAETVAQNVEPQTQVPVTDPPTTSAPAYKMPSTKAEIIEYFNTGANKVKTNAVRVTKNYEKRTVGEMVVPAALQSTADSVVRQYLSDDTTPIVYSSQAEIRENFIVPKQDYVSRLTMQDIKDITIADAGEEFEICIYLKDESNPVSGSGVGSVCDVIEAGDVANNKMVQNFSTNYYNCVVKAKFNKASGYMVWANYTTPLTLDVTVNLLGTHNARIGLTFEKDYVIEY